jgi:hypothetical protein
MALLQALHTTEDAGWVVWREAEENLFDELVWERRRRGGAAMAADASWCGERLGSTR